MAEHTLPESVSDQINERLISIKNHSDYANKHLYLAESAKRKMWATVWDRLNLPYLTEGTIRLDESGIITVVIPEDADDGTRHNSDPT